VKRILLTLAFLALPALVSAQTHPCDVLNPPTSGTFVAGAVQQFQVCWSELDTNGNAAIATGELVVDNGTPSPITLTRGTASPVSGLVVYTGNYTIPATKGGHTLNLTVVTKDGSATTATPFVLTVTLPSSAPVPPVKLTIR
jgi:hypothetical protein